MAAAKACGLIINVSSPNRSTVCTSVSPSRFCRQRESDSSFVDMGGVLAGDGVGAANLVLQLDDAEQQSLCCRRTTRNIDIHRHDAIAAAHHRIGLMVIASVFGSRAHGNLPARLGHLVRD